MSFSAILAIAACTGEERVLHSPRDSKGLGLLMPPAREWLLLMRQEGVPGSGHLGDPKELSLPYQPLRGQHEEPRVLYRC